MKKLFFIAAAIFTMSMNVNAQSALELARQQKELNDINRKLLDMKPTREAKRQAKVLKKAKWMVPAGESSIEMQITKSLLYGEELMTDEDGGVTKRYIMQTAIQTAGSYNVAYASARSAAMTELASMMKTELVGAWKSKADNAQGSSVSTITVDKFNQRISGIVDQSITNAIPVLSIYRILKNGNFEVQVRVAFDKKELSARLKRNMEKDLEEEGDGLNEFVDEFIKSKF